jgi:anti-anti-sigma regulatory factor
MEALIIHYRPSAYTQLEAAVLAALEAGTPVELDLDSLGTLEVASVRELISLLRRCRAIGGGFSLRSDKTEIRKVLAVTALDRLFPVLGKEAAA